MPQMTRMGERVGENSWVPFIWQPRETLSNVDQATPSTQIKTLVGLPMSGWLNSVAVIQKVGTGASFDVEIWKGPTSDELNRIYTYTAWLKADGLFRARIPHTAYANVEEKGELYVKVVPNAAADNEYDIELVVTLES